MDASSGNFDPSRGDDPVIFFYTSISRMFRSNFIGYLYQLCLHRKVLLLTEELDGESTRLLADTTLFPGLVGQIRIGQYDIAGEGIVAKHRRMSRLARELVDTWKPNVVIAPGADAFENYLRRYSKRHCGATTISCTNIIMVRDIREIHLWVELSLAERYPRWIPRPFRRMLSRLRQQAAHYVYYILAPLAVRAAPFFGVNGIHIFDDARLGNMDVLCVLTRENKLMLVRGGAQGEKVVVIPHPLKPGAADRLWLLLGTPPQPFTAQSKVLTCIIMISPNVHFSSDDHSPISDEKVNAALASVVKAMLDALPGWEIRVKPHPMSEASPIYSNVRLMIAGLSNRVVWVPAKDTVETHMMESGAVVVFPPVSAAVYSALMQRPGIPTMVVNVLGELRGDPCIGMRGVVTITSHLELSNWLAMLATGNWPENIHQLDERDFETMEDFVASLSPRLDTEKKLYK